jgi:hypothetical protein
MFLLQGFSLVFSSRVKMFVCSAGSSTFQLSMLALKFIPRVVNFFRACRIAFCLRQCQHKCRGADSWMNLPFRYTTRSTTGISRSGVDDHALSLPWLLRCLTIVKTKLKTPSAESPGHKVFLLQQTALTTSLAGALHGRIASMTLDLLLGARSTSHPGFHLLMPRECYPRTSNGRPSRTSIQWPPQCTLYGVYRMYCTVKYDHTIVL